MENKWTLIITIRKKQLKLLGHILKKEGLENLTLTKHIEGKRARRSLYEWIAEQDGKESEVTQSYKRLWQLWRDMIPYLISSYEWMAEQENRGMAKSQKLPKAMKDCGGCGEL